MIVYNGKNGTIKIDGEEEPFWCGDELNPVASAIARLHEGTISLEDCYDEVCNYFLFQKNEPGLQYEAYDEKDRQIERLRKELSSTEEKLVKSEDEVFKLHHQISQYNPESVWSYIKWRFFSK